MDFFFGGDVFMLLTEAFQKGKIVPSIEIRESGLKADLFGLEFSAVLSGSVDSYFNDANQFFRKTYFTKTMLSILRDILGKVGRDSGRPCYVIDTTFGGGKTHLLVILWHLFKSPDIALKQPQIQELIKEHDLTKIPETLLVALDGKNVDADEQTLWGLLAEGVGANEEAKNLHQKRSSPTTEKLKELLEYPKKPVLILIDELVVYLRKAKTVAVGETTMGQQVGPFLQTLLDTVIQTKNCAIMITLSALEEAYKLEAAIIAKQLKDVKSITERLSWVTSPIEKQEISQIVKKQLFDYVDEDTAQTVAEELAKFYEEYGDQFIPEVFASVGEESTEGGARQAVSQEYLEIAYPFHYTFIDLLYERIGTLPDFQKTRGVLRFLSQVLAGIWKNRAELPPHEVIVAGTVDLREKGARDEMTVKIGYGGFDQVIQTDIVNLENLGRAQRIDNSPFGGPSVAVATAIYMYSFAGTVKNEKGEDKRLRQGGSVQELALQTCLPSFSIKPGDLDLFISDQLEKLWYIYERGGRYFFRTEYNINKVIAERAAGIASATVKQRAKTLLKEHFKGSWFNLYALVSELDRVRGETPILVIFDWEETTTTGDSVPSRIKDLMQRYPGGIFRDEQNLVYCLVPYATQLEEAKESLKRLIAVEQLVKDPAHKKDVARIKERLPKYLSTAYVALELLYTFIAYPDKTKPKLISLTTGNQQATSAQEKVLSALFNARKFTDQLEGWVIDEEVLKDKTMSFDETFSKLTNTPGQIFIIDKNKRPSSPKTIFKKIVAGAVKDKAIGLYNGSSDDLKTVDENNYEQVVEKFYFEREIQERTITSTSLLIPKNRSEELVKELESVAKRITELQQQAAELTTTPTGETRISEPQPTAADLPVVKPPKAQPKIITNIETMESLPENVTVLGFGIYDQQNPSEGWMNEMNMIINHLNLLWRGDDITLSCDFKVDNELRFELDDVPYAMLRQFMNWCSDFMREFASRGLTVENTKLNFKTKSKEGKNYTKKFKEKFKEAFQKAPDSFRLSVLNP